MNIPQLFKDLVYSEKNNQNYIGMGNPNARILIIGREPSHVDRDEYRQDQEMNRDNWKIIIEGKEIEGRCNPRRPFPNSKCIKDTGNNNGTAPTWIWYQKIIDLILGRKIQEPYRLRPVDFHDYCFHTDISSVAARSKGLTDKEAKKVSVTLRSEELFSHPFFRQFPIVILGFGTDVGQYVPLNWCQEYLGFSTSEVVKIQEKPMIWLNRDSTKGRILIHTYSLSQPSYEYIYQVCEIIKGFTKDYLPVDY